MLFSQSRFCRSLFGSVNEDLLYEVCYLRLSRGSGFFLFYPVNNVYHSLYHSFLEYSFSLYHSLASRLQIIPQLTLLSASSHYAGTVFRFQISMSVSSRPSRLCHFTAAYLFLISPVGHDLVSKPVSFCLEEVLIVTGFVPGSRLPDGFSGMSGSGAAGVDTDFAPLWTQPGRNRFRFRRPSLPTNLPRRRGQVHGYYLNSGPTLGANFVARILLILTGFSWFLATGF